MKEQSVDSLYCIFSALKSFGSGHEGDIDLFEFACYMAKLTNNRQYSSHCIFSSIKEKCIQLFEMASIIQVSIIKRDIFDWYHYNIELNRIRVKIYHFM